MQFFWVNLGATHKEAKDGNFLWAPLSSRSKTGKEQFRQHWDNVKAVKSGDLIFCYHDNYIRGVAIAQTDAYVADRPPRASFKEWQATGHRVDIVLTELKRPVRSDDISQAYIAQFDARTCPTLFNSTGGVNQIYMALVPADAALFLLEQADVVTDYEDLLISPEPAKKVNATTREALVQARLGQGAFRAGLLKRWGGKCALTGVQNPNLLVASHIEAWSLADNHARLDTDNGLLLATHIDRLFDCGFISFEEDGRLIASSSLTAEERQIFGLNQFTGIKALSEGNKLYLAKHRQRFKFA